MRHFFLNNDGYSDLHKNMMYMYRKKCAYLEFNNTVEIRSLSADNIERI